MSDSPIIQYVGFKVTSLVREYTFSVREATGAREFILNIANEAFISRRARYQDAPAICALRTECRAGSQFEPSPRVSLFNHSH